MEDIILKCFIFILASLVLLASRALFVEEAFASLGFFSSLRSPASQPFSIGLVTFLELSKKRRSLIYQETAERREEWRPSEARSTRRKKRPKETSNLKHLEVLNSHFIHATQTSLLTFCRCGIMPLHSRILECRRKTFI